jgi:hypothetical protein
MAVYRATSEMSQDNLYLLEIMDPFVGAVAPIPDLNMTSSILKSQNITQVITCPDPVQSGNILFVIPFASPRHAVRMYVWDSTSKKYYFCKEITQDDPLEESYRYTRFISGALTVQSATVSSGNFTISGTVNAIHFQDLPPLDTINFNTLLSYSRDNSSKLGGVPVSEGVVAIAMPDDDYEFVIPELENECSKENVIVSKDVTASHYTTTALPQGTPGIVYSASWQGGTNPYFPNGAHGHVRLSGVLTFEINAVTPPERCHVQLNFIKKYNYANADTWATSVVSVTEASMNFETYIAVGGSNNLTCPFDLRFYDEKDFAQFDIQAVPVVGDISLDLSQSRVYYEWDSVYRRHINGPGALIAVSGLQPSQQINLNGIFNYEAVPNSTLARQVSTSRADRMENNMDMEVAEYVAANATSLGYGFLYNLQQFNNMRTRGAFRSLCNKETAAYHAASFGSIMGHLWKLAKPVLKTAVPVAARTVGNFIGGEELALPLSQVATNLSNRYLSASQSSAKETWSAASKPLGTDLYANLTQGVAIPALPKMGRDLPDLRPIPPVGPNFDGSGGTYNQIEKEFSKDLLDLTSLWKQRPSDPTAFNRLHLLNGGETKGLEADFRVHHILGLQMFPAVKGKVATVFRIVLTFKPVTVAGSSVVYNQVKMHDGQEVYWDYDLSASTHPDLLIEMSSVLRDNLGNLSLISLFPDLRSTPAFVSILNDKGITIDGESHHAAMMALCSFIPGATPITGSLEGEGAITQLHAKMEACVALGMRLLIVNGDPGLVATLKNVLDSSQMTWADSRKRFLIGLSPTVIFVDNFSLLRNFLGYTTGRKIIAYDEQKQAREFTEEQGVAPPTDEDQEDPMQDVGGGVVKDVSQMADLFLNGAYDRAIAHMKSMNSGYSVDRIIKNLQRNPPWYRPIAGSLNALDTWYQSNDLKATGKKSTKKPGSKPAPMSKRANLLDLLKKGSS